MLVDVNFKSIQQIDIESAEAFRILCKTLDMDFVLDENTNYKVFKDDYDNKNRVYVYGEIFDERGDLFIALRNVAVNMFPNLGFRGDDYIYD